MVYIRKNCYVEVGIRIDHKDYYIEFLFPGFALAIGKAPKTMYCISDGIEVQSKEW